MYLGLHREGIWNNLQTESGLPLTIRPPSLSKGVSVTKMVQEFVPFSAEGCRTVAACSIWSIFQEEENTFWWLSLCLSGRRGEKKKKHWKNNCAQNQAEQRNHCPRVNWGKWVHGLAERLESLNWEPGISEVNYCSTAWSDMLGLNLSAKVSVWTQGWSSQLPENILSSRMSKKQQQIYNKNPHVSLPRWTIFPSCFWKKILFFFLLPKYLIGSESCDFEVKWVGQNSVGIKHEY